MDLETEKRENNAKTLPSEPKASSAGGKKSPPQGAMASGKPKATCAASSGGKLQTNSSGSGKPKATRPADSAGKTPKNTSKPSVSGKPKATRPSSSAGKSKTDPQTSSSPRDSTTTAAGETNVSSRMDKLEIMMEKMAENLAHFQEDMRSAYQPRHSKTNVSDIFSSSSSDEESRYRDFQPSRDFRSPPSSAVIDLADDRSVANFIGDNSLSAMPDTDDDPLNITPPDLGKQSQTVPPMAARFAAPSQVGEPLNEEIAETVNFMMTEKLDAKSLEDAATKYTCPSNCPLLEPPRVNLTIWENIPTSTRYRDIKLQTIQQSLVKGIHAFAKSLESASMTENQQDAMALLCNANFALNSVRKEFIKPDMNQQYHHLCKPSTKVTKQLFGDDLGKQVKEIQDQNKTVAGMVKQRYHPYKKAQHASHHDRRSSSYRPRDKDRKSRKMVPGSNSRPFLGMQKGWREPPVSTATAPRRWDSGNNQRNAYHYQQRQSQNQGQGRK